MMLSVTISQPNLPPQGWGADLADEPRRPHHEPFWKLSGETLLRFPLRPRTQSGSEPVGHTNGASIVLIEDNRADVGLVRDALEEHGVEGELIVLVDGERGIQFIEEVEASTAATPHLIILDLNLPRRSGREVLTHLRQSVRCSQIPVVVLSSSDMRRDREEAARLGAIGYFCKPTSLDEFLALGAAFKKLLGTPN